MFKKTPKETTSYQKTEPGRPVDPSVSIRKASIIGPTLTFKGELSANEDLIIDGYIEGVISHQDKNLTVGKTGRVIADIRARRIEIHGEVEGDIYSDDLVKIGRTAVIIGNVSCQRIAMEDGAQFSGVINTKRLQKMLRPEAPCQPDEKSDARSGALGV